MLQIYFISDVQKLCGPWSKNRDKAGLKFVTVFKGLCTEECVWDSTGGCPCIQS